MLQHTFQQQPWLFVVVVVVVFWLLLFFFWGGGGGALLDCFWATLIVPNQAIAFYVSGTRVDSKSFMVRFTPRIHLWDKSPDQQPRSKVATTPEYHYGVNLVGLYSSISSFALNFAIMSTLYGALTNTYMYILTHNNYLDGGTPHLSTITVSNSAGVVARVNGY